MTRPTAKHPPHQRPQHGAGTESDFLALLESRLPVLSYRGGLTAGSLRLDHVSGRAAELTGFDAASLCDTPDPLDALIHPDDLAAYRQGLSYAAKRGAATLEYRLRKPDGETLWCRDEIAVDDGAVTGFLRDITAEREDRPAEDEVLRLRRMLIEQAPHPILLCDAGGRVTLCNRAAQSLLGIAPEQTVGLDFGDTLLDTESCERYRRLVDGLLTQSSEQTATPIKLTLRRADGGLQPVEAMTSVLTLAGLRSIVTELHDISERELARLLDLRQHHDVETGYLHDWLELEIAQSQARLDWTAKLRDSLG